MMNTKQFCDWAKQIEELQINSYEDQRIYLLPTSEDAFLKLVHVAEKSKNFLSLHPSEDTVIYCLHNNNLDEFVKIWKQESTTTEQGVPDLSWATCKQIGKELKNRDNLVFALIWMEMDGRENLSIEAGGDPTLVTGMVARGMNLIIKWAGKDFREETDEHSQES